MENRQKANREEQRLKNYGQGWNQQNSDSRILHRWPGEAPKSFFVSLCALEKGFVMTKMGTGLPGEIEETQENGINTIYVILTIEGAHVFNAVFWKLNILLK